MNLENTAIDGKESEIKIACIQFEPLFGQIKHNLEKSLRLIRKAANNRAGLIVLPELCNTGYVINSRSEAYNLAEEIPNGETTRSWIKIANENQIYLIAGIAELEGVNLYNSAVIIGPNGYIGTHRKLTLWNKERLFFEPGNLGNQVFNTKIGRLSALICYDMWFPEQWRNCALGGADIICCPTNWITIEGLPQDIKNFGVYIAQVEAHVNNIFVAVADRIGKERGCEFPGRSMIVNKDGCPIIGPIKNEEEIIYAEVNLSDARRKKFDNNFNAFLDDRRTDLWGPYIGKNDFRSQQSKT